METFGDALRRLRMAARLSQAELAKAAAWSQSQVSRAESGRFVPDEATVARLDQLLQARGTLIKAHLASSPSSSGGVPVEKAPWAISDLMRQIHRTDVGHETIDQLSVITEELCCEYAWRNADDLRRDAQMQLEYVGQLLNGPTTLHEHRELMVNAGWLTLLIGCVDYDLGLPRHAESARTAAYQLGRESGHGEIVAWSFEMSAWFALTQDRLRSVAEYTEAGSNAAPNSSVVVQLSAQAAKAQARMGNRAEVEKILDEGYRLLGQHQHPLRPENHFVIDPTKWDFYAMDCYRLVGDNDRASEHAHEVLKLSRKPDGTERSPMRASEARLTLAVSALESGDVEASASWAHEAFNADRRSVTHLAMLADELSEKLRELLPGDPAAKPLEEELAAFRASLPSR
ncbi:helix-turn-helix domain-containing protein [Saccharothrix algeriensis]|uniref:Transcriptional regulator with XRE-family HTH domain n=3 Tax=Saccharothrix algeriensis TaxID=173560 RepID=A0ABS2S3N9_9PSEU|nr:helix-turn-helix transcriptional regulator [Saccharothrix algeriensis]MBM7810529.1 transcriptional regulator with XRE-family HTH domain [Saccharothrix algeriensis]